jgi:hypothetical protein
VLVAIGYSWIAPAYAGVIQVTAKNCVARHPYE